MNIPSIVNFTTHYKDPAYDRTNNPLRRSVEELLPIAVSWSDGRRILRVDFSPAGIACLLGDSSGVAIVDSPFGRAQNKAYVVNTDGSERFILARPANVQNDAVFSDVYYVDGLLCFFMSGPSGNRRIECDATTGRTLRVVEAR